MAFSFTAITGIAGYIAYLKYNVAKIKADAAREQAVRELERANAKKWERTVLSLQIGGSMCGMIAIYVAYRKIKSAINS